MSEAQSDHSRRPRQLRSPWRAVSAMFVLNGALFGIWASRIPAVSEIHELSPGGLGLLLLLMAAGAILSFPLAGRAADRIGAAHVTRRVALAYVLGLVLLALAPNLPLLAAALFVFGAAHGSMDVAMNAWASEVEARAARPMMSSFHAMFSLGAGLGALSGYAAASIDAQIPAHFLVAGCVSALLTLYMAQIPWVARPAPESGAAKPALLPRGALLVVGFVAFCGAVGEGAMADWSAIFLVLTTGASEADAALGFAVFSIAMVAMRLIGDLVVARIGPVTAGRLAGTSASLGALIAVGWGSYGAAMTGFALMGIGYALIMPLAFSRAASDPDLPAGAAIASVATFGYGGILIGPPMIGVTAELISLPAAFLILAVLAVFIVIFSDVLRRI
ncbi:MFS transporter [Phaeobacter inhibens]|uniref:MFS transporter n=1 Tax=Phaeobacter inhibens TaxID=221822 RepID=UPI000CA1543C|nr:MFS transporter [Phaeobacter inhibens]AUQ62695.1 putative MFS-type transporter [Phaeobacter inhibens]AUQ82598.1 putative MFS-type transporter [Phaeobacter inhibens]AUQ90359.1 putative MFS-type transporter [Phaeobacter inhibens]MDO6754871.1 MFS transporter [Phaeobacter inhibens]